MKINKEKLQAKLEELKNKGRSELSKYVWKPKPGDHKIRILPYPYFEKEQEDTVFPEIYIHNNIGRNFEIVCLEKNFGESCPICEYLETLLETEDQSLRNIYYRSISKPTVFCPILLRDVKDEDGLSKVQLWKVNKTNQQKLIEQLLDDEYEDMLDLQNGIDLKVEKEERVASDQFSGKINIISFSRKSSPVANTKEDIKTILKKIPNVMEIYERKSTDDLKNIITKWINGNEQKEEQEENLNEDVNENSTTDFDDKLNKIFDGLDSDK